MNIMPRGCPMASKYVLNNKIGLQLLGGDGEPFYVYDCTDISLFSGGTTKDTSVSENVRLIDQHKMTIYGTKKDILYITYDTEFYYKKGKREILSWQFTTCYKDVIKSFIVFPTTYALFSINLLMQYLQPIYELPVHRYPIPKGKDGTELVPPGVSVYIVGHYLNADIKCFREFPDYSWTLQETSGIFSSMSYKVHFKSKSRANYYSVWSIKFIDSFNWFPTSLESIGDSLGIPKLGSTFANYEYDIAHMDETLKTQTQTFLEYACRDTEILMYMLRSYFSNLELPVTAGSYGTNLSDQIMFGGDKKKRLAWRGVKEVKKKVMGPKGKMITETIEVPASHIARELEDMSKVCFLGGINQSIYQGYYEGKTYDYDLCNAYPTVACLIPDINYKAEGYLTSFVDTDITLDKSRPYPYNVVGFGSVSFEFPPNTMFPNIPTHTENGLIYCLNGSGVYTDWCTIKLALNMGAKIKAHTFKLYAPLYDTNGEALFSLRKPSKAFVEERVYNTKLYGKKSVQAVFMKLCSNASYGKVAQAVQDKRMRVVATDEMVELPPSKLSSGVHAAYYTSIPRNVLLASMEQLSRLGYISFSVTTDGFISNAPLCVLEGLDLFGMADMMMYARQILGDTKVWECKHTQDYLLNITTRVNQGWDEGCSKPQKDVNVDAHTGYKGDNFLAEYLNREKTGMKLVTTKFPSFIDQHKGCDFVPTEDTKILRFNYDFKRAVDSTDIEDKSLELDGVVYTIPTYNSKPYKNFESFVKMREKLDDMRTCIMTKEDLKHFINRDKVRKQNQRAIKTSIALLRIENEELVKTYIDVHSLAELLELIQNVFIENKVGNIKVTQSLWYNSKRRLDYKYITDQTHQVYAQILERIKREIP